MSEDIYRDLLSTCIAKPDISLFDDYPSTLHPAVFRSLAEGTYQVIGNGCLPISSLPALNKAPGVLLMRTPSGGVGSGKKVT